MADKGFYAKLGLKDEEFRKKLQQNRGHLNNFAGSLKSLAGPMAAAFSVAAIVDYTKEAMDLAGKLQGVREAFMRISDQETLEKLKEATRGTVSELDLMKNAVKANNFKIPLEQLATFFEFATKRAAQTGESVDYLVESIILGIGRKSPLILDNLGISAIELREKLKGVGMESASVGDVTVAMGQIIEDEMQRMGDVSLTAGQKMQALRATAEDMKTAWGELAVVITDMLAPALTSLAKGMKDALEGTKALTDSKSLSFWDKLKISLGMVVGDADTVGKVLGDKLNPAVEESTTAAQQFNEELEKEPDNLEETKKAADEAARALRRLNDSIALSEARRREDLQDTIRKANEQEAAQIADLPSDPADVVNMDYTPSTEAADEWLAEREKWIAAVEEQNQRLAATMQEVANAFVDNLALLAKGEQTFKDFVFNLIQAAIKAIAAYLAQSVAAAYLGGAEVGGPAAPLTGAANAAMAASLFGSIVPALMAEGGRVPSGYPNDSYPAMLTSKETVLPPEDLNNLIHGNNLTGSFRIKGSDLVYIVNKETNKLSRNR